MFEDKKIIIVTGSRFLGSNADVMRLWNWLDDLNPDVVVQGGAAGADHYANQWAKNNGRISITHNADWENKGKQAGPIRNIEMLEHWGHLAYCVLAFPLPNSVGTKHMVRASRARNLKVINGFEEKA